MMVLLALHVHQPLIRHRSSVFRNIGYWKEGMRWLKNWMNRGTQLSQKGQLGRTTLICFWKLFFRHIAIVHKHRLSTIVNYHSLLNGRVLNSRYYKIIGEKLEKLSKRCLNNNFLCCCNQGLEYFSKTIYIVFLSFYFSSLPNIKE